MILRLILLLSINLSNVEVEQFMLSKGVKIGVQLIRLADVQPLGSELAFFQAVNAAFNYSGHKMILVPPYMQGSKEWMAGYTQGKTSTCVFNLFNERNESRKLESLICIAHELAHQCGLKHTQGCISITDGAAMACPNKETLGFLPEEVKKLNRCK
jgi:hypothetical protein